MFTRLFLSRNTLYTSVPLAPVRKGSGVEGGRLELECSQALSDPHPEPSFGSRFSGEVSPLTPGPSPTLGRGEPMPATLWCVRPASSNVTTISNPSVEVRRHSSDFDESFFSLDLTCELRTRILNKRSSWSMRRRISRSSL